MKYSVWKIKAIGEDKFTIYHFCTIQPGSFGGLITNLFNFKVMEIQKGSKTKGAKFKFRDFLKIVIDDFNEKIKSYQIFIKRKSVL